MLPDFLSEFNQVLEQFQEKYPQKNGQMSLKIHYSMTILFFLQE
jgi:hypothetical protein